MRNGNFGLKIVGGEELDNGLVLLGHSQKYKIRLVNYDPNLRCNAKVEIDGKVVGNFRIEANNSITIERPHNDTGQFTFYRHGTPEAKKANLLNNQLDGFIVVSFVPEELEVRKIDVSYCLKSSRTGGTGLSGQSTDKYKLAEKIEVNNKKTVAIKTRLLCHDEPRPLI